MKLSPDYLRLFEHGLDEVLWLASPDGGELLYISPAFERLSGIPFKTLRQDPGEWRKILHPDDRRRIGTDAEPHMFFCAPDGKSHELRFQFPNGEIRWVWARSRPVLDGSGETVAVAGCLFDVTERRRAVERLTESEATYRHMFDSLLEGIGIVDHEEVIQSCNSAFVDIFEEKEEGDLIGRSLLEMVPPDQVGLILGETEKRRQRLHSRYELQIITRSGNRKRVIASISPRFDHEGNYLGGFGAIFDLTERLQAEQAIRESGLRFRELADLLPAIVLECNVESEITYANQFAYEATGYTPTDFQQGFLVTDLIVEADRERVRANLRPVFAGEPSQPNEYYSQRKDGSIFPVVARSSAIMRDGQTIGFRSVAFDIADQKQIALELQHARDELEQRVQQRTEELSTAKDQLEIERQALREKNVALREVLNVIEEEKRQIVRQIQANIDRIAMPLIARLQRQGDPGSLHLVRLLEECMSDIGAPFLQALALNNASLTQRELEICNMVRSGMLSKEIAETLHIAEQTVIKQRAIIRRKLGISGKKVNLESYLKSDAFDGRQR